jgi:hypothetical protein
MDGPGFHVDVSALDEASSGITQSVADQKSSELEDLCRDEQTYGHDGVHGALKNFCDRWNDGLDLLTEDAKAIGDTLGQVARAYRTTDAASGHRFTSDPGVQVVDD